MTDKDAASTVASLQKENAQLKKLVRELKAENLQLQNKVAKIEAKHVTAINRVKTLEKLKTPDSDLERRIKAMSSEDLENEVKAILIKQVQKGGK